MKKRFTKLFFFWFFAFNGFWGSAQNTNPLNLGNIVPPSPEVSSLGKYIEMPVSYSSGIPSIQIPIYSIQSGPLEIPVSLAYNAGGIRVEEAATWTGLGWSVNAGGSVSRVVHGLPDDCDTSNGYMYTANTAHYILNLPHNDNTRYNLLYFDVGINQTLDVEPDEYTYSVLGYSGRFYFNQQTRQFVQAPHSTIKISTVINATKQITGFILTLPNGVKCYFGTSSDAGRTAWEYFESQSSIAYNEQTGYSFPSTGMSIPHITSWQLLDVVSPSGKSIHFYYTTYESVDYGRGGESVDYAVNGAACTDQKTGNNAATGKKNLSFYEQASIKSHLSHISTDVSDVWFKAATHLRQDVMAHEYTLDTILVNDKNNTLIKGFAFNYGYFTSTDNSGISPQNFYAIYSSPAAVAGKRLRLDSLHEFSTNLSIPSYKLFYNITHILPDKLSANQDFWGFYNGKINGFFTIPSVPASLLNGGGTGMTSGADRTVNIAYASACILNKIVYPTGGSTQYFYESNMANAGGANLGAVGYQYSGLVNKLYSFWNSPDYFHNTIPFQTYVDSFDVGVVSGQANIITSGCSDYNSLACPFTVTISGISDPTFSLNVSAGNFFSTIPHGRYKITTTVRSPSDFVGFSTDIHWSEFGLDSDGDTLSARNMLVGGLRIRKIVSSDSVGNILSRSFKYKSYTDSSFSSGQLMHTPVFLYNVDCGLLTDTVFYNPGAGNTVVKIASSSALPLASPGGELVRYINVTEYQDTARTMLKTEMEFSNDFYNYIDPASSVYPYKPNVERNWRKDLLLKKRQYINNGINNYQLVTAQTNFYTEFEVATDDTLGIFMVPAIQSNTFDYTTYSFVSEWYLLDSTVNLTYAPNTPSPLVQSIKYFYDPVNGYTVARERSTNSKGQIIDKKNWYISDFSSTSGYPVTSLIGKNIINNPLRQEVSNNGKLLDGQIVNYYDNGLPKNIYKLQVSNPIDTVPFNPTVMVPGNYALKQTAYYDSVGNTNEVNTANDITRAFLWDYSNNYPICDVVNADTSTIAYTSFEADGKGNWSFTGTPSADATALTGTKVYILNGSNPITKSGLSSATTYIVSYWTKNASSFSIAGTTSTVSGVSVDDWKYFEHKVTGQTSVNISGTGAIDELRLYPVNAQMKTYTYNPLVGVTSECDINNRITYYSYDSLGRMVVVKDMFKNIIKTINYHYKNNAGN